MKPYACSHLLLVACWLGFITAASAQFSTDTCCRQLPTITTAVLPPYQGHWELGLSAGISNQYQRTIYSNKFFGAPGPWVSFSADYFLKRHVGLGLQAGYFGFSLQRQNEAYIREALTLLKLPLDQAGLLEPANLHSFHLVAGPVVRVSLGRRLTGSGNIRAGVFFNDAPITGAFDKTSERLLFRFSPAADRFRPGLTASAALERTMGPSVRLGLRAGGFLSKLSYNVDGPEGAFFVFSRALVGYTVQVSASVTIRNRRSSAVPAILPGCYTPILPEQAITYDVDKQPQPVFTWHSGAPVYTTDEVFTFRLYALPGNKLIDERSTDGRMLPWLQGMKVPDSTAQFYYTIQASRRDQTGQSCVSPVATGSMRFYKQEAVRVNVVRERAPLTIDIYEVRLAKSGTAVPKPVTGPSAARRKAPVVTKKRGSVKAKVPTRPTAVSVVQAAPPTVDVLIYREVSRRNDVVWPSGIPYPEKPTLYLYVLRTESGAIEGRYNLLVTPGMPGTIRVMTDVERTQWLRKAVQASLPPATK
ncbi:PorT family protein [Fibrivirga algicola]|uniref:PorT family protein n=1 Tax=Fibrivirga algicola TaxID=2950420 RepID=A0ABX0QIN7_9BACT|nr:PorT family protein [Fibrivirga algicola]NID10802.1 PorT family protein [Fibrivirga algicola]